MSRGSIPVRDEDFDERAYLVQNPDIARNIGEGGDARTHFDNHGRQEGRHQAAPHPLRDILFIQTCDSFKYPAMLASTSQTAIEFCRRKGYQYEMYIGLKRGYWNWQAIYNRIPLLKEKLDQGYRGWIVYMDTDSFINDLDFDLHTFLEERADHAGVFVPALADTHAWNVNDGVFMINLGHPQGRRLVDLWYGAFMALSDDWLRAQRFWSEGHNDQDMVQDILRTDPAIGEAVLIDRTDTINSSTAAFIRQALRANFDEFSARVTWIGQTVADIFAHDGQWSAWRSGNH